MSTLNTANPSDVQLCAALGNANSAAVEIAGVFALYVWGTFGGTAKLQVSPDNETTWIDYPGASFTANGVVGPVYLGTQQKVRISNTAGSVNATLAPIP